MASILTTIEDKYSYDNEEDFGGFIVFVSNSPETKKGMLPPIMTLCDYDIETLGTSSLGYSRFSHIAELDLTDNLLSEWKEVFLLLNNFPSLEFLNLSNNLLSDPISEQIRNNNSGSSPISRDLNMKKFVLNGNTVDWESINFLTEHMPQLEELFLSTNNLKDPDDTDHAFHHNNLRQLYLSCNPLTNFEVISDKVGGNCPLLELLSLAECPLRTVPSVDNNNNNKGKNKTQKVLSRLTSLNLSTTKISTWTEVEKLRKFESLNELRLQHCPVLSGYSAHERRMLLIARLPNVQILNGGDKIPDNEREDAERAFIRFYLDSDEKPERFHELVAVHGRLDPLVNISMEPDTHVKVKVCHKESIREETIKVYQSVQQFKALLQEWFKIPPQNMKLYYCDKDLVELAGPEEMKWPQKELYTYNVQNGDKFILDEKVSLGKLRVRNSSTSSLMGQSPSHKLSESPMTPGRFSFMMSPKTFASMHHKSPVPKSNNSKVSRNLFDSAKSSGEETHSKNNNNSNNAKNKNMVG